MRGPYSTPITPLTGSLFHADPQRIIGKKQISRSLGTDSPTVAKSRALRVAAQIELEFEIARSRVGLVVDPIMLEALSGQKPVASTPAFAETEASTNITFGYLYDAYMDDPTRDWSPTTRMAYQKSKRRVVATLGADTPARSIVRRFRDMIEVLRRPPRNASKLLPKLSPVEKAKARAAQTGSTPPT